MPRKKRISRQNFFHHVMFRGINGENIFIDDGDRSKFCLLLQEASEKHGLCIHGFCLMSNHIHLLLEPTNTTGSLHFGIHAFAFRYAQYFNRRHKRCGYLFQGRYKSILIADGIYLKRVIRYIHLNAVEANIVLRPEDYRWSSYRAYLEQDHYTWLQRDRILKKFCETRESAIEKFVEYTHRKIEAQLDLEAIAKGFRRGVFGEEEKNHEDFFQEDFFKNRSTVDAIYESLNDMIERVCLRFNVKLNDLSSANKSKSLVHARAVIAFIVRRSGKWSLEELGRALNKNSGTLSRLASKVEMQIDLLEVINELSNVSL